MAKTAGLVSPPNPAPKVPGFLFPPRLLIGPTRFQRETALKPGPTRPRSRAEPQAGAARQSAITSGIGVSTDAVRTRRPRQPLTRFGTRNRDAASPVRHASDSLVLSSQMRGRSVRRREFIALVGAAAARPLSARAQDTKVHRIAIFHTNPVSLLTEEGGAPIQAFFAELRRLGLSLIHI